MKINGKSIYELMDERLKDGASFILKVKGYSFKEIKISYYNNEYFAEDELGVIGDSEKTLKDLLDRFDIIESRECL